MGGGGSSQSDASVLPLGAVGKAPKLTAEELESLCARTGFDEAAIQRLYVRFFELAQGEDQLQAGEWVNGLPELEGPFMRQLPVALGLDPGGLVDFTAAVSALAVFGENAPVDDKMLLFFKLYDLDGDGLISKSDLRFTLRQLLPKEVTAEVVDHAVDSTMEELGGHGTENLTQEQFTVIATDLVSERGVVFF